MLSMKRSTSASRSPVSLPPLPPGAAPRAFRRFPLHGRRALHVRLAAALAAAFAALVLLVSGGGLDAAAPEPASSDSAMVVTPHAVATRAGLTMLRAGGNAVDAAAAAAFALGVAQPQSMGIGGGLFLLWQPADGPALAIDARETAPAASTTDMYLAEGLPERASSLGGLAVGTPGMVAGLELAVQRYGTRSFKKVLAPAVRAATEGVRVGPYLARAVERVRAPEYAARLARFPETARIHLAPGTRPQTLKRQPELARTLRTLARRGARAFYEGDMARAIAATVQQHGGILTVQDLADYEPLLREPLRSTWRGMEIVSFPPPSSGGVTLVQVLKLLEGFELGAMGAGSSEAVHTIAEAMKPAFADRALHLGDPGFARIPTERLLDKAYLDSLRSRIGKRAAEVKGAGFAVDDGGTAHISVVDAAGNAVALTATINGNFGSFVTVPGYGILLNNEMDDFVTDPDGANIYGLPGRRDSANLVEPGKRPLSSMAPTIVREAGEVRFVIGGNGGPRIITSVLLSLLGHFVWDMNVSEAIAAPRFHHQWRPDQLRLEKEHPVDVVNALRARGHALEVIDGIGAAVHAIARDREGRLTGAADPRRDGLAEGF